MNEEIKEQIINCPVCKTQLKSSAKFCSECGTRLAAVSPEPTWVAAMHERIDHAKDNDLFYTIFAVLGALTAIVIPFVMRFVFKYTMDPISWSLTIVGIIFFFAGYAGILYNEKKAKDLIQRLEEGDDSDEEAEEEE